VQPLADPLARAVGLYCASGNYRGSEPNFRDLIVPFAGRLGSEQHDQLLDAVIENGQNWGAANTPSLLLGYYVTLPPPGARRTTHGTASTNTSPDAPSRSLQRRAGALFQVDGRTGPPPLQDDEE
jgi:hypothetical protein